MRRNTIIPTTSLPSHTPAPSSGATYHTSYYPELPQGYVPLKAQKHRLVKILTEEADQDSTLCVIHGYAGVGKSCLATSLIYDDRIQDEFADGIYWIDVGPNPYDLVDQLNEIGADVSGEWVNEPLLEKALLRFHEALADSSILLIFDDVVDIQQAVQFRPTSTSVRSLLTTRNERISDALKTPQVVIGKLSPGIAADLLGRHRASSAESLIDLVHQLGDHPFTLRLAGLLEDRGLPVKEVLDTLNPPADDDRQFVEILTLTALLQAYYEAMTPNEQLMFFSMRIFLPRVPIAPDVIKRLWSSLTGDESQAMLDELMTLGLINRRHFGDRLVLHDWLIQTKIDADNLPELSELHFALLRTYNPDDAPWWTMPDDGYVYRFLFHHLAASGRSDLLTVLLLEYEWLKSKAEATGPVSLYEDYNLVHEDKTLRVIQEAIRLSAEILVEDPGQIGTQLIGRLQEIDIPALKDLVRSIRLSPPDSDVWLDPYRVHLNVPASALLHSYKGHEGIVHAVAVDAEYNRIVSASSDHTLRVWDLVTGAHVDTLEGHEGPVHLLSLTKNNRRIISCGEDQLTMVWDLDRKSAPTVHRLHRSKILAVQALPDNRRALSSDEEGRFLLWEIDTGKVIMEMAIPNHMIWAIAVDPSFQRAFTAGDENVVRVWDLESGMCRHILSAHDDWIWCLKVTPDGRQLLSGSEDRSIVAWDLYDYKAIRVLKGHQGAVRSMDLSQNGKVLVSASDDQSMIEWNLLKGAIERSFTGYDEWVWDIAVTPEGHSVLTTSDDSLLKLWSLTGHTHRHQNRAHEKGVRALKLTPDNNTIVSASDDASLIRWHIDSGKFHSVLKGHKDWIWDLQIPTQNNLAISGSFDHNICVWDLATNKRKFLLNGHQDWVWTLALSWDNRFVFSGSEDATIRIWDLQTGRHLRTLEGHTAGISALLATDDNQHLVSASQDHTVRIWRISDGAEVHVLEGHTAPVTSLVYSPLDQRVASGSDDGTIRLWNYQTGYESDVLIGDGGSIKHIALTGLGTQLVSASEDFTLRIWDIALASLDRKLEGHKKEIRDIAVSRDGRLIASVSDDQGIFLWHLQYGDLLARFYADHPITRCLFSIDDQRIIAGDAGGGVHFLRVDEMLLFT